jgi:prepilin-type N-terminal cleavage/methylation domain-containing protein
MNNSRGFTIPELLIAMSIASIVVLVLSAMNLTMYRQVQISQSTAELNSESYFLLRGIAEDIKLAANIATNNSLEDNFGPAGGWNTNSSTGSIIISSPAVDSSANIIYNDETGLPFQNELIYYKESNSLLRRIIANSSASGNEIKTTCPPSASNCLKDKLYTKYLDNFSFTLYESSGQETLDATKAEAAKIEVSLSKKVAGKQITISNSVFTKLRNRQ